MSIMYYVYYVARIMGTVARRALDLPIITTLRVLGGMAKRRSSMDAEMLTTVARLREAAKRLRSVGFVQLADQVEALAENVAQSQLASKAPRATRMNVMVPRALVASALALLLIAGSVVLFAERETAPTAPALLQILP